MGEDQAPGSIAACRLRVTEGQGYQIIFGMDLMVPLHVTVHTGRDEMTYRHGYLGHKKEMVSLRVYKRNTVRLAPVAHLYRDFHAASSREPECAAVALDKPEWEKDDKGALNHLGTEVVAYIGP